MNFKQFATASAVVSAVLGGALAVPATAQVLSEKALSVTAALTVAQTAYEACLAQGYKTSVTVVGREGQVLLALRGDGTSPHTYENSFRKAYTARSFRVPSGDFAQRVKDNPTLGVVHLANVVAVQGGLPILAGDEVIAGVGVSGAPGGEKDEACAKAGIDKIAASLK